MSCPIVDLGCSGVLPHVNFRPSNSLDLPVCLLLGVPTLPSEQGFGLQDFVFEVDGKETVVFTRVTVGGTISAVAGGIYTVQYLPDWKWDRTGLITQEGSLKYWTVQEPPEIQGVGYSRHLGDVVPGVSVEWSGFNEGQKWESNAWLDCPVYLGGKLAFDVGGEVHVLHESEFAITDEYVITVTYARQPEMADCVGGEPNIGYEVMMRKW